MQLATIATFSISGPRLYRPAQFGKSLQGVLGHRSERARTALLMAVLFVAYVSAAKLGIETSVAHGVITPVWAPTGIALAALVLYGPRLWPAVALGAFVANATSGLDLLDAAFISVGNTLEAVVGSLLLLRVGFRPAMDRVRDVFSLIVYGALLSTTIAATNGVTVSGSQVTSIARTAPNGSSGGSATPWAP